jgi:predicted AlkP superfamily pyrophosphatase or phosphodiesterase
MRKILVLQVAALGCELLRKEGVTSIAGLPLFPLTPVAPAVTCVAQASLRTALPPQQHQLSSNGRFFRETFQSQFWCQSSNLVKGARIWDAFRQAGGRVGLYFFQQSLGERVDEIVSPAPIHLHNGGMVMATYQQPAGVFEQANPIALWRYWGPLASPKVGDDIVDAMSQRIARGDAPEALFLYLPTLDYDLQRYGTSHKKASQSVKCCVAQIERLCEVARKQNYNLLILGDYAITDVKPQGVSYLNRTLAQAGYFKTRMVKRMLYPDFYQSRAFALCDHQTALIYCLDSTCRASVRDLLMQDPAVDTIVSGVGDVDFEVTAKPGMWFAYPWWSTSKEAPDYATHVDIHNKPGFDPCELFFGRTPFSSSMRAERIRGTHGRVDAPIAMATDLPIEPKTFLACAKALQDWLSESVHMTE